MNYNELLEKIKKQAEATGNHPSYEAKSVVDSLSSDETESLLSDMTAKSKRFEPAYTALITGTHKRRGELTDAEVAAFVERALSNIKNWAVSDIANS